MSTFFLYLQLGYEHIIPYGADHILFVVCLFLSGGNLKSLIALATTFTIAHSLTLALAMAHILSLPASAIEPLIALSILIVAIENMLAKKRQAILIVLAFLFGLVHGMGFAGALSNLGLPKDQFLTSLLSFNLGVELGQLTILTLLWFLVGKWFCQKSWYRPRIVIPASLVIAGIAVFWTIERIWS